MAKSKLHPPPPTASQHRSGNDEREEELEEEEAGGRIEDDEEGTEARGLRRSPAATRNDEHRPRESGLEDSDV